MPNATAIVKEHRKAVRAWRKRLQDPRQAREFLIHAGILSKDGDSPNNTVNTQFFSS